MPHISYSELKDWAFCAFYHKLTRVDKIDGFKGNAFTAFGTAIHDVCEKKLLKEDIDDDDPRSKLYEQHAHAIDHNARSMRVHLGYIDITIKLMTSFLTRCVYNH